MYIFYTARITVNKATMARAKLQYAKVPQITDVRLIENWL